MVSDAQFLLLIRQENSGQVVRYSAHHLNNRLFDYQTTFDHLNTRLVLIQIPLYFRYLDPYVYPVITFSGVAIVRDLLPHGTTWP